MRLHSPDLVARYVDAGYWGTKSLSDYVRLNCEERGRGSAFVTPVDRVTWDWYDTTADAIATRVLDKGMQPGDRVAVLLHDGPLIHAAFLGCERAGLIVVGLGANAARAELRHLITKTGARALCSTATHRDKSLRNRIEELDVPELVPVELDGIGPEPTIDRTALESRRLGPNDLFLLNSTSGTTGMPKCVTQFQNRWMFFHQLAVRNGRLTPDDVFMSLIPSAFGFGLWTAHFTPTMLGCTTVVMPRFDAAAALQLIQQERVTVMSAVTTQLLLMLGAPTLAESDFSSLRVVFTGGEAVPYERMVEFEERTASVVLQFYGSNETGAASGTSIDDRRERRLTTAGRVIPEMDVRLFDDDGHDITGSGAPGQPGVLGPAMCAGYHDDPHGNEALYTRDGHMLIGDYVTIDADGYLTVVGRKADFIIRGGKNISAAHVEGEVGSHPDVELVAVVAAPDPVFGERVCAVVTLKPGTPALSLNDLTGYLNGRGVSKELHPEYLALIDTMPIASGGKIAKGSLRERIEELVEGAERSASIAAR